MEGDIKKIKPLKLLIAIVDMNKGEKLSMFLNDHDYKFHFVSIAEGTAPSEIRSYWGFEDTQKSVVWALIPGDSSKHVLSIIKNEFMLNRPNTGVVFIVPIESFADPVVADHISKCGDRPENKNEENGEEKMDKREYSLLMAIVKKAYSDEVMAAAREVGAKGGTILKARGTGEHEITKFLGITIEPEKDIILILTKREKRSNIMKTIYEKAGLHTEGNGLILALPVDEALGSFNLNHEMVEEIKNLQK
ncbi:MAG: P-II family nitrogen regulator [Candidatus Neomarinimicrobiota bacterium]